jgi:DNA-binding LacI/PurR family transcriptional regulator
VGLPYHVLMKTRLEDIAARAGVSVATVSRVVNGKAGVSERTRRTVMAELEVLGYERPAPARVRSGLVGLIVPELDNPIFPAFVQAAESALVANGYTPLLCTAGPVMLEDEYVDMLLDRSAAGIVFVSGRHANTAVDHGRYHELRAAGVPMVFVNGYLEGLDAPFVSADDAEAMRTAVQHLQSLGHRRIGCAMGPARYVTSQRKVLGFQQRAEADDDLVVHSVYSVEGGQAAAETLLDRDVTAVVCGSDLMALGAIRAARSRGLQVPREVSVTGYDDSALIAFTDPPLTTVRKPIGAMASAAVATLLEEIKGMRGKHVELMFQPELVVRRSTGSGPLVSR